MNVRGVVPGSVVAALAVSAAVGLHLWPPLIRASQPPEPPAAATDARAMPREAPASWADEDWAIFQDKVRWALDTGLDRVPLGDAMAALGRAFVGTAYVPHTLEAEGPETLVINFRGLDCVTFVENVLALARFVREPDAGVLLGRRAEAEARYAGLLMEVRYRDGRLDGYASRLHYFSDWIRDNEARGLVRDVGRALGGVAEGEPVDFMTAHPDAYGPLADPATLELVRATEVSLSAAARYYVPQGRIADVADGIHDGDIIAATSTVPGLDVAHTGLALWVDGELRLLHAPLVGSEVQISETTLAQRILRIDGQDGIMVARPAER